MIFVLEEKVKNFPQLFIVVSTVIVFCFGINALSDASNPVEIRIQNLNMNLQSGSQQSSEALLPGEIADTDVNHIILTGPSPYFESLLKTHDEIFIFIKGHGRLSVAGRDYKIEPESIALPFAHKSMTIKAEENDTLHYIKIQKKLSVQDIKDIKSFPLENRSNIYFTSFDDCEPYTEKIKSPNTVSRTVLPKDHVPRVAMGTVEADGPDKVGAHEHPMLDQLFLGLAGNDVFVQADGSTIRFPEFSILHIPIGSSHGVSVDEGKKMYYQWMDFFLTKEGEVWLKTHKPIEKNK